MDRQNDRFVLPPKASSDQGTPTDRRNFLLRGLAGGSAWMLAAEADGAGEGSGSSGRRSSKSKEPKLVMEKVRVGLVGAGDRGTYLLRILLGIDGVSVRAICDTVESRVTRAQAMVEERRQPKPEGYSRSETDYERLCGRDDLDLVINATPGPRHHEVSLFALQASKHVGVEPPAALSIDQCWKQVEAAEKSNRHCALLENYCYQRDVMMIRNMIRQGLFGELMHLEGGYQRDSRDTELKLNSEGKLAWQGEFRKDRMGNVAPTHDLGPLAQWMDIHRGDRFDYLVSMGGIARAFNEYGAQYFGPNHFLTTTQFAMSDINVCLIRTMRGRTVYLLSDTLLSRPQPRNVYRLLGSKGLYDRTVDRLYLEGKSPKRDRWHGDWEPVAKYYQEFDHPLWREMRPRVISSGVGGDYLCLERLIYALRMGISPDMDVYDAAALSAVVELSEQSARNRSRPVDFPDFTRGRWESRKPIPIVTPAEASQS